jgi:hypothetical protein
LKNDQILIEIVFDSLRGQGPHQETDTPRDRTGGTTITLRTALAITVLRDRIGGTITTLRIALAITVPRVIMTVTTTGVI